MPFEPYADHKKAQLVARLSSLPDGIQDFLETALPAPPTVAAPTDESSAILVTGMLSKYLLDVFAVFAGLTLAAVPLHVGQLNDWHNAGIMANLRKMAGIDERSEASDLLVVSPQDGASYTPGALRIQVRARQGTLFAVTVSFPEGADQSPLDLSEEQGEFWGLASFREEGDFTLEITGDFGEDRDPVSKTITITINAAALTPAETGGQDDLKALDLAKKVFDAAAKAVLSGQGDLAALVSAARQVPAAGGSGGASGGGGASGTWATDIEPLLTRLEQYEEPNP